MREPDVPAPAAASRCPRPCVRTSVRDPGGRHGPPTGRRFTGTSWSFSASGSNCSSVSATSSMESVTSMSSVPERTACTTSTTSDFRPPRARASTCCRGDRIQRPVILRLRAGRAGAVACAATIRSDRTLDVDPSSPARTLTGHRASCDSRSRKADSVVREVRRSAVAPIRVNADRSQRKERLRLPADARGVAARNVGANLVFARWHAGCMASRRERKETAWISSPSCCWSSWSARRSA